VTVIDVGGQSTNYVNARVDEAEEMGRLVPTVTALAEEGFVVSVDTFRPAVAAAAIEAGAALLNDTSGLQDDAMVAVPIAIGFGFAEPLLWAAAIGAPIAAVVMQVVLSRRRDRA